jgi:anti-anti-sigma factor
MTTRTHAHESTPGAGTVIGADGAVLARITWRTESAERARVTVEGDVDRDTAPALRAQLLDALASRPVVCCDLASTAFFSAAGVDALVQVHVAAAESGRSLVLAGVGDQVRFVLDCTGVLTALAVER